jgi:hypothetical protein
MNLNRPIQDIASDVERFREQNGFNINQYDCNLNCPISWRGPSHRISTKHEKLFMAYMKFQVLSYVR